MINIFSKYHRVLKRMDLLKDQNGIWDRFLQESGGWTSHLENTKKYILQFCENKRGILTLLGSGWLLDIPIDILAKQFKEVYLVDIYHPAQIKHLVKPYKNVKCIEMDITGGAINSIYTAAREWKKNKKQADLKTIQIQKFIIPHKTDVIISVNILSQLGTLLIEFLTKNFDLNPSESEIFLKNIQQSHIDLLTGFDSCMISDYEEWIFDSKTNHISRKNLLFIDIPENASTKHWDWLFDMSGNYFANKRTILKVFATKLGL
jgi:hypothetical protein